MDKNKLQKLKEINYKVPPACGLCRHGTFKEHYSWGDCSKHEYVHNKHSGGARRLSIFKGGTCMSFAPDWQKTSLLGTWNRFTFEHERTINEEAN